MSWSINGKMYHNWDQYEKVKKENEQSKNRRKERKLRLELETLRGECKRVSNNIHDASRSLIERERSNEKLSRGVQSFTRLKQDALEVMQKNQQTLRDDFAYDQQHFDHQIEQNKEQIASLEESLKQAEEGSREELIKQAVQRREMLTQLELQHADMQQTYTQEKEELKKSYDLFVEDVQSSIDEVHQHLADASVHIEELKSTAQSDLQKEMASELNGLRNDQLRCEVLSQKIEDKYNTLIGEETQTSIQHELRTCKEGYDQLADSDSASNAYVLLKNVFTELVATEKISTYRKSTMNSSAEELAEQLQGCLSTLPNESLVTELAQLIENKATFNRMRREGSLPSHLLPLLYYGHQLQQVQADIQVLLTKIQTFSTNPKWDGYEHMFVEYRKAAGDLISQAQGMIEDAPFLEQQHRELRLPTIQGLRKKMKEIMRANPDFNMVIDDEEGEVFSKALQMEWGNKKYTAMILLDGRIESEMMNGFSNSSECADVTKMVQKDKQSVPVSVEFEPVNQPETPKKVLDARNAIIEGHTNEHGQR